MIFSPQAVKNKNKFFHLIKVIDLQIQKIKQEIILMKKIKMRIKSLMNLKISILIKSRLDIIHKKQTM